MKGHRKCQKDPVWRGQEHGSDRSTDASDASERKGLHDHLCSARALLPADESQRPVGAQGGRDEAYTPGLRIEWGRKGEMASFLGRIRR